MGFFIFNRQNKQWLSALFILFTSVICGSWQITVAVPLDKGRLDILDRLVNTFYTNQDIKLIHRGDVPVSEGYDNKDCIYYGMFNPEGIKAKIVSIIPGYELEIDVRPIDSTSPVNLELSIHGQNANRGDPITMSCENVLKCSLPISGAPYFYNFGKKPITLWERTIIDPNENPNDPNNYTLSFMADIREAIDNGTAIPLADLNGTYGSEVPYAWLQVRFDKFPGDSNLDGRVDLEDLSYIGRDWMVTDINSVADISGSIWNS